MAVERPEIDPHPLGPGLYWGIEFKDFARNPWTIDIWGWDPFDYAVRQATQVIEEAFKFLFEGKVSATTIDLPLSLPF